MESEAFFTSHPCTSTHPTYKTSYLHWTYLPTPSNHACSRVDMFPISEQHCPYILNPKAKNQQNNILYYRFEYVAPLKIYNLLSFKHSHSAWFFYSKNRSKALYCKGFQPFSLLLICECYYPMWLGWREYDLNFDAYILSTNFRIYFSNHIIL